MSNVSINKKSNLYNAYRDTTGDNLALDNFM
jgi:hypothetical protein